ncbi:MAG: invasion associated locus B family protein [Alphaproteobacteria bacterium]
MTYQASTKTAWKLAALAAALGLFVTPASASTKTEQTFGSWKVTCMQDTGQPKRCSMAQPRVAGEKKQIVFVWVVHTNASRELMNSIQVPAAVSIKEGVRVSIGNKAPVTVPYEVCASGRCVASFNMDGATLQAMSSSQAANANYVMFNRKLQQVQVDLKEFAKAYEYFKGQLTSQ